MAREELRLESARFTTSGAFVREIIALIEFSDYRLILVIPPSLKEQLDNELEGTRCLGRVRIEEVK